MPEFPNAATQFKAGNKGGPGRPRTRTITERLAEALETLDGEGREIADRIVQRWVDLCLEGDVAALRELMTRLYGKPVAPIHLDTGPITIAVVYEDAPIPHRADDPPEDFLCLPSPSSRPD